MSPVDYGPAQTGARHGQSRHPGIAALAPCGGVARKGGRGFDIVYVYAGHIRCRCVQHFMLPHMNHADRRIWRLAGKPGPVGPRTCLRRPARSRSGDTCAVAFRFAIDEMHGTRMACKPAEEGRAVVELAVRSAGPLGRECVQAGRKRQRHQPDFEPRRRRSE